jgi:hypothetical protein
MNDGEGSYGRKESNGIEMRWNNVVLAQITPQNWLQFLRQWQEAKHRGEEHISFDESNSEELATDIKDEDKEAFVNGTLQMGINGRAANKLAQCLLSRKSPFYKDIEGAEWIPSASEPSS